MTVSTIHPEYAVAKSIWRKTRDASAGEERIKIGDDLYLPRFVPDDKDRYKQYKLRAYFMGATGRTKNALLGMVFRKPPTVELPPAIEALQEDIDGAGMSMEQLSKEAACNLLETGRHVLLVDYPSAEPGLDAETERQRGLRPTIASYHPEALINWRFEGREGRQMLTLAVLQEAVEKRDGDEFAHDFEVKYRVLRLRDGVYTQQLYGEAGRPETEEYSPRMAGGATFDHIPLHIVGAENNQPNIDMPPLYDLAVLNIAHYQTTADHRENLYLHGQLTLGITSDMAYEEFQAANPDGVQVGARRGHFLGSTGSFHTATVPESSSLSKELADLEDKMAMIGARLIQRGGQAETAEAARINASAEASTLDTMVNNLSEGIEAALEDMALFMGANPDAIEYKLNTDFWESGLDAQTLSAVVQGYQSGTYAAEDALHMIRRGRVTLRDDRTDEQILEDAANDILPGQDDNLP